MVGLVERLIRFLQKFIWVIGPYFPGTSMNTIWRQLDKQGKDILDVGGGHGEPMGFLGKRHNFRLKVNADIMLPHLKESKQEGAHGEYVLCDARYLPFKKRSFDIVLCLEVIEHLEKEDSFKLLSSLEEIARRQIILSAPVGERIHPEPHKIKTFPWAHFSSWHPAEFRRLGYKVRGDGFPTVKGYLLTTSANWLIMLLGYLLYPIASLFVYFFPNRAGGMTCIKKMKGESRGTEEVGDETPWC